MDVESRLKRAGFTFSKRYGQNFITDEALLGSIADDAGLTPEDTVLEIGAGAGTLTRALAARAGRVFAFEIDERLRPVLDAQLAEQANVTVIYDDVTKWSEPELDALVGARYKVVANLPYYITTPLLFMFLERKNRPESMTVMVQKEVAERIVATEKKGDYGALSVSVAVRASAKITRQVPRSCFVPPPNVDSAVIRIDLREGDPGPDEHLFTLVRRAFAMKRKTLVNNLTAGYGIDRDRALNLVRALGKPDSARAEQLSPTDFLSLADLLAREGL